MREKEHNEKELLREETVIFEKFREVNQVMLAKISLAMALLGLAGVAATTEGEQRNIAIFNVVNFPVSIGSTLVANKLCIVWDLASIPTEYPCGSS